MYIASTKYESFFDWVFSIEGIITILAILLLIWLIYKFFIDKVDVENKEDVPNIYPPMNNMLYNNQLLHDESFWDGFNGDEAEKQSDINPIREEEPLPPNAIPPSHDFEEDNFEELKVEKEENFVKRSDGLYEKEVTKKVVEDDVLFDDVLKENIPVDESVNITKKEHE